MCHSPTRFPRLPMRMPSSGGDAKILGEGDSSRLQDRLKFKKGMVTNISTYLFSPKREALFYHYCHIQKEKTFDNNKRLSMTRLQGLSTMVQQRKRLRRQKILFGHHTHTEAKLPGGSIFGNYQTLTGDPHYPDKYLRLSIKYRILTSQKHSRSMLQARKRKLAALVQRGLKSSYLRHGKWDDYVEQKSILSQFAFMIGFAGASG